MLHIPYVIWTGKNKTKLWYVSSNCHLFVFVGFLCNNLNSLHFCIWHPKGLQFLSYRNPMPARIRVWKHCRQVSCFNVLGSKRYKAGWHRNTRPGLLDLYNVTQMVSQHVQFLFIANFRNRGAVQFPQNIKKPIQPIFKLRNVSICASLYLHFSK